MASHLSEQEIAQIKQAVAQRRTPETLVEGKWSVSPLNRDPRVIGDSLPKRIVLRDITLRTAEQAPGVWLTVAQRRHLAEGLVEVGVQAVQAGWFSVGTPHLLKEETAFLHQLNPRLEVSVLGASKAQADIAADSGVDLYTTYAPAMPEFHLIYGVYGRQILRAHRRGEDWRKTVPYPKDEQENIERMQEDVAYAKKLGLRAAMYVSMLHYATPEYLTAFAKAVHEVGADEIGLGDGASGLGPEAWRYIVGLMHKEAPNAIISTHTHNCYGLAAACALSAFQSGAGMAEVAVNHLCSSPQADLAEVAASLEVLYGVSTGIDLSKLVALRVMVEDLTGIRMSAQKPITGSLAGVYTEEAMFEEEEYAPVHKSVNPALFGSRSRYMFGRFSGTSGAWAVRAKLAEEGLELSNAQMEAVVHRLKEVCELRGRTLSDEEMAEIARDELRDQGG